MRTWIANFSKICFTTNVETRDLTYSENSEQFVQMCDNLCKLLAVLRVGTFPFLFKTSTFRKKIVVLLLYKKGCLWFCGKQSSKIFYFNGQMYTLLIKIVHTILLAISENYFHNIFSIIVNYHRHSKIFLLWSPHPQRSLPSV